MPSILSELALVLPSSVVLATLLVCAGLALGIWLGRARSDIHRQSSEANQVLPALERLFEWTARFSTDVSEYQTVVGRLAARFSDVREQAGSEGSDGITRDAEIVGLLEQLVSANKGVQQRLAAAEERLQTQASEIDCYVTEARTDALTGLPNRRAFDDELSRRMAEWRRHGTVMSVMLIDVDRFKLFNDQHGHLAGDAVLRDVARVLQDTMRESDLVARFGGEEFAVVLSCSDIDQASLAAERARRAVQQRILQYEDKILKITVSCGVAQVKKDEAPKPLIARADAALYAAKNGGRNMACWHDGKTCRPVKGEKLLNVSSDANTPNVALQKSPEFQQVCVDLRSRMKDVIRQELQSAQPSQL